MALVSCLHRPRTSTAPRVACSPPAYGALATSERQRDARRASGILDGDGVEQTLLDPTLTEARQTASLHVPRRASVPLVSTSVNEGDFGFPPRKRSAQPAYFQTMACVAVLASKRHCGGAQDRSCWSAISSWDGRARPRAKAPSPDDPLAFASHRFCRARFERGTVIESSSTTTALGALKTKWAQQNGAGYTTRRCPSLYRSPVPTSTSDRIAFGSTG
uniref:Uncharacterized protein n=1 Tax=Mycena chlorophos TaxID=658473 RepID=A0ABQ0M062_MYCCL|nr:predicted protein [Mycena chlorophos]